MLSELSGLEFLLLVVTFAARHASGGLVEAEDYNGRSEERDRVEVARSHWLDLKVHHWESKATQNRLEEQMKLLDQTQVSDDQP